METLYIGHMYLSLLSCFPFSPQLDEGTPPDPKGTFVDYQTTVVKYSKAIAVTAQEMVRNEEALYIIAR